MNLESIYEAVVNEIEQHGPRKGLWAMAFAKSGGNDSAARAFYIEARAQQLIAEQQAYEQQSNAARAQQQEAQRHAARAQEVRGKLDRIETGANGAELRDLCVSYLEHHGLTVTEIINPQHGIEFHISKAGAGLAVLRSLDNLRLYSLAVGKRA
jgi:outer membrane murein-binding lipoprotein Lpp